MSNADAMRPGPQPTMAPLSWPPPGLEKLQGLLWRATLINWAGSVILVLPLLWALAVEQPFYSLGPFEENWQVGMGIALLGGIIILFSFGIFFGLMRASARAADDGYGTLTILEVLTDKHRDTGFLIQGKRHFGLLDANRRMAVVSARLRGAGLVLAAALWFVIAFGLAVTLAARGFLIPSDIWLITVGPTGFMLAIGLAILGMSSIKVHEVRSGWDAQEGSGRVQSEALAWTERLDQSGDAVVLGSGPKGEGNRFRLGATVVVLLFLAASVPTMTVAVTASIGPILAEIAVPAFLTVQEMAGGAEALRLYVAEPDPSTTPARAGWALQNIGFVGGGDPEPWELAPQNLYEEGWFPDPVVFPDPFSESTAFELMSVPFSERSPEDQAAMQQAAQHPAHAEFHLLSSAALVDVVRGRWVVPFPDSLTFEDLPWPRFQAFRTAGLAQVAKAAVEAENGQLGDAEHTLRELISTGFLLIDQGPTLIDNLMGVVLTDMGGDALEAYYARIGEDERAEALEWAREGAAAAASRSRAGTLPEDIHSRRQGVPTCGLTEGARRGLRWEYFATFNMLAPCINLHKMVFGPDETYDDWRLDARDALVRVRGERDLFELAEGGALSAGEQEIQGFLPRFLSLTLGSGGAPGSCASLIASLQSGD